MGQRKELTARQEETLDIIRRAILETGVPPSMREIGAEMKIASSNGVADHLKALVRKGYIERDPVKSRLIRLIEETKGLEVLDALEHRRAIAHRAGRLPVGRFTPREFAEVLARMLPGEVEFADGVITVGPELSVLTLATSPSQSRSPSGS